MEIAIVESNTVEAESLPGKETAKPLSKEYVYILRCSDGTFYTGWTNNLEHRLKVHNAGKGAKYTHARLPVELVYYEEYEDRSAAKRREYAIKKLTRAEKIKLIRGGK